MASIEIPLVSFTIKNTYNEPEVHAIAKESINPCKPMIVIKIGNSFNKRNDVIFIKTLQVVNPIVRV